VRARWAAALVVGTAFLSIGATPAGLEEVPLAFITVDSLRLHMEAGRPVDLIDVRTWSEYVKRHITGARSMPLRAVPRRMDEIRKTGLVVFY
jgi:hypothetical protein